MFPIGPHCEYKVDACSLNKCRNLAGCVPDGNTTESYICICPVGFTGAFCETNIDDCVNSKCTNNAKCIDKTNGYHCVCEKQYFGTYCEKARTPIKNCEKNCNKDRGFCQDNVCACAESFEGKWCDKRKNYCFVEACFNNGSCVSNSSGFTCNCSEGKRPQPAFTSSKLTIETLEQGVKYIQRCQWRRSGVNFELISHLVLVFLLLLTLSS